jgi:hypothetical protein
METASAMCVNKRWEVAERMLRARRPKKANTGDPGTEPARRTILQKMVPGTVPTVENAKVPKITPGKKMAPQCDEAVSRIAVLNPAWAVPEAVEKAADATDQN